MISLALLLISQPVENTTLAQPKPAPMAVGIREARPLYRIMGDILAGKELVCELPDTVMGLPTRSGSTQTGRAGDASTKLLTLTKTNSELFPEHSYDLGSYSGHKDGSKLAYEGTATAPNSSGSTVSFATLIETEAFYVDEQIKFIDLDTASPRIVKVDIAIPKGTHSSPQAIKTNVELGKCGDDVGLPESVKTGFQKVIAGLVDKDIEKK